MRSSYGRSFTTAMLMLFLAVLSLGAVFRVLVRDYMEESALDALSKEATAISHLALSYSGDDSADLNAFYLNLEISARVTGSDILMCDNSGKVVQCSESPFTCRHRHLTVSGSYLETILASGEYRFCGLLNGLYEEARYLAAVPICEENGQAIGILLVSTPVTSTTQVLNRLEGFFFYTALVVFVISFIGMSLISHREARPLQDMAKAANAFGHGDLEARVQVSKDSSDEVQELAVAFNNMASSLQKSEYQRQEFVANVSHELKTPMTTIAGYVDGILDGTILPERQEYYLRIVSDETKRLSRLVRSMLDISQLGNGSIPEDRKFSFDMEECVGQVLVTFEKKINDKHLDVDVRFPEHPLYTFADRDAVTQVVYNLLDNAIKFCPDGKTLGVSLKAEGSKVITGISNEGDTIPPEELPLVFDRFHKLDKSRSQNRDGWGLGLYIVKSLVCSHGEDIRVTSRDGVTEFTFTMPLVN